VLQLNKPAHEKNKRKVLSTMTTNNILPFNNDGELPSIGPDQPSNLSAEELYRRAAQLGIVAGFRSSLPFAALAWTSKNSPSWLKAATGLAYIGEVIADKLPATPSRLSPGPFVGRIAFGAVAGALLGQRYNQPLGPAAVRGAIGAVVGSIAGNSYRTLATQLTGTPDFIWALLEDTVAVNLALRTTEAKVVENLDNIASSITATS
jgi:uncharacterized membrane protein